MSGLAVALLIAAIALPHLLRLSAVEPSTAALTWAANLALRALAGVLIVVYLVLYLPSTGIFAALTHWCWHTLLPVHLGLNGHSVGDVATVLPIAVIGVSVFWAGVGLLRVARSVRRLVTRAVLGAGPRDSLIVGGPEILVAAAGLARPKVLVSAGALIRLDDEELAAGLDHERGHIARGHRWILIYAEICRALGIFVPGTRRAVAELNLHLERDADRWAIARRHDRLALASAIVKAAASPTRSSPPFAALGGRRDHLTRRIEDLVDTETPPRRAVRVLAVGSSVLTFALAASVPATVAAGLSLPAAATHDQCPE